MSRGSWCWFFLPNRVFNITVLAPYLSSESDTLQFCSTLEYYLVLQSEREISFTLWDLPTWSWPKSTLIFFFKHVFFLDFENFDKSFFSQLWPKLIVESFSTSENLFQFARISVKVPGKFCFRTCQKISKSTFFVFLEKVVFLTSKKLKNFSTFHFRTKPFLIRVNWPVGQLRLQEYRSKVKTEENLNLIKTMKIRKLKMSIFMFFYKVEIFFSFDFWAISLQTKLFHGPIYTN